MPIVFASFKYVPWKNYQIREKDGFFSVMYVRFSSKFTGLFFVFVIAVMCMNFKETWVLFSLNHAKRYFRSMAFNVIVAIVLYKVLQNFTKLIDKIKELIIYRFF